MAQYESSDALVNSLTSDASNLDDTVKAALKGATVEGFYKMDGEEKSPSVNLNEIAAATTAVAIFGDSATDMASLSGSTAASTMVGNFVSGSASFTTTSEVVAEFSNSNLDLTLNSNSTADNIVILNQATGGIIKAEGIGTQDITLNDGMGVSVDTGAGDDVLRLNSSTADADMSVAANLGNGDNTVILDALAGTNSNVTASVDAGTGFDMVQQTGEVAHNFSFVNGQLTMNSGNIVLGDGIDIVSYDVDGTAGIQYTYGDKSLTHHDHATFIAGSAGEGAIARAYKIGMGRSDVMDSDNTDVFKGIKYWSDRVDGFEANHDNVAQLIKEFLGATNEFASGVGALANESATKFVDAVFDNAGFSDTGAQQKYIDALESGEMTAEDVVAEVVWTDMQNHLVQGEGIDGDVFFIDAYGA